MTARNTLYKTGIRQIRVWYGTSYWTFRPPVTPAKTSGADVPRKGGAADIRHVTAESTGYRNSPRLVSVGLGN